MGRDIKELVSQMTLEEKASMVSGKDFWHTDDVKRLGIPSAMVSDGPHGLRKQADQSSGAGINDSIVAVCFPTAVGTAASFDRDMLRRLGETLGEECRAEDLSILLGPAVNIKRSPLCGRNFEYFSEDPFLAGELAQSYINGVQSKNVGTSIKHFAVNNQEKRRMTISAVVDERTLREIYFPAFEIAVKKSQPWTVMCSYNKINGVYSSENNWLLNEVLRKEWGFQGYVMTDWGACNNRVKGLPAGLDLEMPSSARLNTDKLIHAVYDGKLDEKHLDTACERILEKVFAFYDSRDADAVFDREADHQKAREAAAQSMVLLKNENILPLSKEQKIAFIGAFAENPCFQGGGSSHIKTYKVVGALEAARDYRNVRYAEGFSADADKIDEAAFRQAVALAKDSDVAVVFAGLPDSFEAEGADRTHLNLPRCQNELIERIAEVNPNVVVVLHNGAPVLMPWLDKVKGVLESYLAGEAVGEAQCDLLFGDVNPSGKLAETFPLAISETPCYRNFPGGQLTVEYREGIYVGYRYYDTAGKKVLFPFGHGLSYTTFAYSGLKLSKKKIDEKTTLTVTFKVKNTGERDGAESMQIYVAPKSPQVFRPVKEMKEFAKVFLKAGEEKTVSVELNSRAFAYYNTQIHDWYCESGAYDILVGASSRDIRLEGTVTLKNTQDAPCPYVPERLDAYYKCHVSNVSDEEFSALLGFPVPEAHPIGRQRFTLANTIEDAAGTRWGGLLYKAASFGGSYVLECPLHSTVAMSQGALTEEMGDALVSLLNNENVIRSMGTLIKGGIKRLKNGIPI